MTGNDIVVVPEFPSLTVTSPIETAGFGAGRTANVNDLKVDSVPALTVRVTCTDVAVSGGLKEQRATPPLSDWVCVSAVVPAVALQETDPCVSGPPVSLVTFAETANLSPATAWAGVPTTFPITGLPF